MSVPRMKFDPARMKLAVKLPGISQWLVVRGGTACWEKGDAEDLADLPELIVSAPSAVPHTEHDIDCEYGGSGHDGEWTPCFCADRAAAPHTTREEGE